MGKNALLFELLAFTAGAGMAESVGLIPDLNRGRACQKTVIEAYSQGGGGIVSRRGDGFR